MPSLESPHIHEHIFASRIPNVVYTSYYLAETKVIWKKGTLVVTDKTFQFHWLNSYQTEKWGFHSTTRESETFKLVVSIAPFPQRFMLNHNREVSSVKVDYFICCLNWIRRGELKGKRGRDCVIFLNINHFFWIVLTNWWRSKEMMLFHNYGTIFWGRNMWMGCNFIACIVCDCLCNPMPM